MALRRQPPHHRLTLVSACVFDTAPTSRAAGTSLVVRTNCTGNFPILLHDSTSSSRRSAPPEWWTSPARTAPWPWSSSLREPDASGFSVGPRTGSAVCSGHACRLALPGTSPPQHAVTASSPRRCTFGCSSGGLCHTGYTERTSAGTSASRTSEDDGFLPPHTLHACFWRGAASRCTSRSTASEPRTQARRARWAPQWLLGGPSSSWASLSALRRNSPQPPHKFSVSPGPPQTPQPGHHARHHRTAGPSNDHDDDGERRRKQLDVDPHSRGSR